jgi:hypothetical protein
VLADLGYLGEADQLTCPIKKPANPRPAGHRAAHGQHAARRDPGAGRARELTGQDHFKALRRVSLCPWRIGAITADALVLLRHEHDRTT